MDADSLNVALESYRTQLLQVDQALLISNEDNKLELLELKSNLEEVIKLTEESLLTLKKSELLDKLSSEDDTGALKHLDDSQPSTSDNPSVETEQDLSELSGLLVQSPFSHEWGGYQYHNAVIISHESVEDNSVRVMFLQPTHRKMLICEHYMNGNQCRYDEDKCQNSHGHVVPVEELREYEEPLDPGTLSVGDSCLARYESDNLWYKAAIVDKHEENVLQVMYTDYDDDTSFITHDDVLVIKKHLYSSSDESSSESENEKLSSLDEDEQISDSVRFIPELPGQHSALGSWESHTKGVGSKIMSIMGYREGEGLGKTSQGRVEPVPIHKLPPGKSLDKIMQLKLRTGNSDMFNVLKKKHNKKKTVKHKIDVFAYLNKSFTHHKQDLTKYRKNKLKSSEEIDTKIISKKQLSKKSDRGVNIQMLKTEEEVYKTEKEIISIQQRLEVNRSRKDAGGIKHLEDKLISANTYLEKLQSSQRELQRHKGQREARKKLTVF